MTSVLGVRSGPAWAYRRGPVSRPLASFRGLPILALPATRPAGRRVQKRTAQAESSENLRGDHEPGPFVTNAPRAGALPATAVVEKKLTVPTILTLCRLTALPIILTAWFKAAEPAGNLITSVFLIASATDYLDGYIARKLNQKTAFGAFLDPVVDKLLVAVVLILLSTRPIPVGQFAGNTVLLPVVSSFIITREILMSAVREWAATKSKKAYRSVAVSDFGKYKTGIQMVGISLLLYGVRGGRADLAEKAITFGIPLVAIATLLTVVSLIDYMRNLWAAT